MLKASACQQAGSRPGRRGTFLCLSKEKYPKERAAAVTAPSGFLALLGASGKRANSASPQTCALLHPLAPALLSRARTAGERNTGYRIQDPTRTRHGASLSNWILGPHAVMRRRVAQTGADQGRACLRRSRVCAHPAQVEQRSVPAQPGDESGSPSLCLLSLGEARESEAPAGAQPGQRPLQRPTPQLPWIPGQAGNDERGPIMTALGPAC